VARTRDPDAMICDYHWAILWVLQNTPLSQQSPKNPKKKWFVFVFGKILVRKK
jgi:hypothetical protein